MTGTSTSIDAVAASAGETASAAPGSAVVGPGSLPLRRGQHEDFAQGVAAGLSQRDAAVAAGFSSSSNNSARLAAKPHVAARIEYLRREFNDTAVGAGKLKLAWLQRQYVAIALADPDRDRARLCKVASFIEIDADGKVKFEIDRKAALDALTKTIGGFVTKAEITGADGGPVELEITDAERIRALAAVLMRARVELEQEELARAAARSPAG